MTLEVCVETCQQTEEALAAGANRLELCSCLSVGGVTPSIGLIQSVRKISNSALVVLIRIRPGNFVYSETEISAMISDARVALDNGADAVAVGALSPLHEIDERFLDQISNQIDPQKLVFHRAFDLVPNGVSSMKRLIEYHWRRILTCGISAVEDRTRIKRADSASENTDGLQILIQSAGNQIEILPAGGINDQNATDILRFTGAEQLHGSFSKLPSDTSCGNTLQNQTWQKDAPNELNLDAIRRVAELIHQ